MGVFDTPPPHVTSHYLPVGQALMGTGGVLWTTTYFLMSLQSLRDRTYAMPLFALSLNLAVDITQAAYVLTEWEEASIFGIWVLIDLGIVYAVVKYGHHEWTHSPVIGKHVGKILGVMVAWCCWVTFALAQWWLTENVNSKPGKWRNGVEGVDKDELGFWAALLAQFVLSCSLLAQILVRGNSGGASYTIWACRFLGSFFGLNVVFAWMWWTWPEAHPYFINPVAICLLVTWFVADIAYLVVLRDVKKTETVLKDGRKVRGGMKMKNSTKTT